MNTYNDYTQKSEDIERRRKFAQLLQQQSIQPLQGQSVGGIYVAPHWTQQAARALQGVGAQATESSLQDEEKDLSKQYNQSLIDGLTNYQNSLGGDKASRQAALAELLKSGNPTLQQAAIKSFSEKPESLIGKAEPKDFKPASLANFARTGDYSTLDPIHKRELAPSGQVYDPYMVNPGEVLSDPNKPFSVNPSGGVTPNTQYQNYELSKARTGATNVSVNTAPKAFFSDLGKGAAEGFLKEQEIAQKSADGLTALQEARKLLNEGVVTGLTANGELIGRKLLGINPQRIANTEAFISTMGRQTLGLVKELGSGSGISNADKDFAEKVAAGTITLNEGSIRKTMDINERASRALIQRYNKKAEKIDRSPNSSDLPFGFKVNEPPMGAMPTAPQGNSSGLKILSWEN